MLKRLTSALGLMLALGTLGCDNGDPGIPFSQPEYRWQQDGECSSGERGNMMFNEINFGGSVRDDGTHDADDIFIELWNRHPRPINVSNWRLELWGQTDGYTADKGWLIPVVEEPIPPNGYFVIAKKRDGAFAEIADVFIEDLELGKSYLHLEIRDCDFKLMEDAGSTDVPVFSGGYDTYSVRSMERAQLIFQNRGGSPINWHANSQRQGHPNISDGWRARTYATPGAANSVDYSGATGVGDFE